MRSLGRPRPLFVAVCSSFLFPQILAKITAVAFMVHLFSHVAAVTIDPADASVRAKQSYSSPMPLFDRSKQSHVIQDLHCYLCDVKVYVFAVSHWGRRRAVRT